VPGKRQRSPVRTTRSTSSMSTRSGVKRRVKRIPEDEEEYRD
jgi:hypothetical protein